MGYLRPSLSFPRFALSFHFPRFSLPDPRRLLLSLSHPLPPLSFSLALTFLTDSALFLSGRGSMMGDTESSVETRMRPTT